MEANQVNKYKVHVYQEFDEGDTVPYIEVFREDLETGVRECLRSGYCNWPEAIVKTCVQIGVPAALYDSNIEVPEEHW
jgi:hypothetical protein